MITTGLPQPLQVTALRAKAGTQEVGDSPLCQGVPATPRPGPRAHLGPPQFRDSTRARTGLAPARPSARKINPGPAWTPTPPRCLLPQPRARAAPRRRRPSGQGCPHPRLRPARPAPEEWAPGLSLATSIRELTSSILPAGGGRSPTAQPSHLRLAPPSGTRPGTRPSLSISRGAEGGPLFLAPGLHGQWHSRTRPLAPDWQRGQDGLASPLAYYWQMPRHLDPEWPRRRGTLYSLKASLRPPLPLGTLLCLGIP